MRQHRALRPTSRARGVKDRGKIAARTVSGGKAGRLVRHQGWQRAIRICTQRQQLRTVPRGDRRQRIGFRRVTQEHRWRGIPKEVVQFIGSIGGVQRQKDRAD